jgi:hypothetical protein
MSPESKLPNVKSHPKSTDTKWARMGSWLLALLTFNLSLLTIQSCGLDIEDPTPPSPPQWVQKSLPEEWPERGIDAHESGGIFLEWEDDINDDIIAYKIYRATQYEINDSLSAYSLICRIETESSPRAEYRDETADLMRKYFYKIKAEDVSGNLSEFSDSVSFTILSPIELSRMTPNGITMELNIDRSLSWYYVTSTEMEDYILSIITLGKEPIIRTSFQPGNYVGGREYWHIPSDIKFQNGRVYQWRIDTGADYRNGIEKRASESPWAVFLYSGE